MKEDKYLCEECTAISIRAASARASAMSGAANGIEAESLSPNLRKLMSELNLREFSIRLTRLTAQDLGFTLEPNTDSEYETTGSSTSTSSASDTQTYASSSDESNIKPHVVRNKKVFSSESDGEEEVIPTKRIRLSSRNPFVDSDTDHKEPEFDINDNSKDLPSSNPATLLHQTNLSLECSFKSISHNFQLSSSEEEQVETTGTAICKSLNSESSDDQVFDKENEKPGKNVAVVRPFSRNETSSSDSSIKPAKIQPRPRKMISSNDEDFHDFPETVPLPKQDHFVTKIKTEQISSNIDGNATASGARIKNKLSPSKRKHRSILSYFRESSSSDDEVFEQKPKRKSTKPKQASPAMAGVLPKQSTIMHFFKKHVNQNP